MTAANDLAVRRALELAGVEFIDEYGGGPGVRLRKPPQGRDYAQRWRSADHRANLAQVPAGGIDNTVATAIEASHDHSTSQLAPIRPVSWPIQ